jgi:hypothetical protein
MDVLLFRALAARVHGYLDAVDTLATAANDRAAFGVLRTEVRRLVAAWRALLKAHRRPDGAGCASCRRGAWQRRSFCSVWRTANAYFVAALPIHHLSHGR